MQSPLCEAFAVGDFSSWGRLLLNEWQADNIVQLSFEPNLGTFCRTAAEMTEPKIVLVENGAAGRSNISQLRSCSAQLLILWMGKNFSREDIEFALEHRVYALLENPSARDKKSQDTFIRANQCVEQYFRMSHLSHSIKSLLLQAESKNSDEEFIRELKTGISKLERLAKSNELLASEIPAQNEESSALPLPQSQGLGDVLLTLAELERTGTLWIRGNGPEEEGKINFLQGKVTVAEAGAVSQLKAIYRMFCWEKPRFLFNRKNPEMNSTEIIPVDIADIVAEGGQQYLRAQKIKNLIPPNHLKLDLVSSKIDNSTALNPMDFYTLIQVAQFHHVSDILDYSDRWDVSLLESLIHLKKSGYIRLVA